MSVLHNLSINAKYRSAEDILACLTAVGCSRSSFGHITPRVAAVGLTSVGYIWSGLFLNPFHLVDKCAIAEEIDSATFSRLQAEWGVKACLPLVAIYKDVCSGVDCFVGECPGCFGVILVGNLERVEVYGSGATVVEFYP